MVGNTRSQPQASSVVRIIIWDVPNFSRTNINNTVFYRIKINVCHNILILSTRFNSNNQDYDMQVLRDQNRKNGYSAIPMTVRLGFSDALVRTNVIAHTP